MQSYKLHEADFKKYRLTGITDYEWQAKGYWYLIRELFVIIWLILYYYGMYNQHGSDAEEIYGDNQISLPLFFLW